MPLASQGALLDADDGTTIALTEAFKEGNEKAASLTIPQQIIKVCERDDTARRGASPLLAVGPINVIVGLCARLVICARTL